MKKPVFIFFIFLFLSCISKDIKEKLIEDDNKYFLNKVEEYISENKFILLNKLCKLKLEADPENYYAAYYQALSTQKVVNNLAGLNYYSKYMQENQSMPIEFEEKWIELALNYTENTSLGYDTFGLSFYNDLIQIDPKTEDEKFCDSKILESFGAYFFLNEDGILYMINKATKSIKKVNYYKTRSFVLMDDYIVFNDSINVVKYDFIRKKYSIVYSFEKDQIYFSNRSLKSDRAILKYVDSDFFTIKLINFENNELQNIPNNTIAQSQEFEYLVIGYEDRFEVFDITGNFIVSYNAEFLGFSADSKYFYYYNNKHLCSYNLENNQEEIVIYIPEYKINKGFKAFTNNKILFCFDDYMLEIVFRENHHIPFLIKGELIHIFKSGYIYKNYDDNRIYFYSMYFNTRNLIYQDKSTLDNIILPDNDSYLFLIKKEDHYIVNNLSDFFP